MKMAKIMHLTHTDVRVDQRILRAMGAGAEVGHDVAALGICRTGAASGSDAGAAGFAISTLHRPTLFRRRATDVDDLPGLHHLEVSHGKTGPVRHVLLFLWLMAKSLQYAKKFKPQIVHAHDMIALPIAVMIRFIFGSKVIYDAHELESAKAGSSRLESKLILTIEKNSWNHIQGFVTVSAAIGDWYQRNLRGPRAVIVLNSPERQADHDGASGHESSFGVRAQIGASDTDIICIYVGALENGRGVEELIRAFPGAEGAGKLAVLGDGSIRGNLQELALENKNVFILDPVSHRTLVRYIRSADYGFSLIQNISLSDYLCLPNKMFEYLHAGLTLICSDFPEMSKIVKDNRFGHTVASGDRAVSRLLEELLNQPRPQKIEFSRIQSFTWETQKNNLTALYSRIGP